MVHFPYASSMGPAVGAARAWRLAPQQLETKFNGTECGRIDPGTQPMTDRISYFEATSFLADLEPDDISDPEERIGWLVARLQEKWPALSVDQAVAYIKLFEAG